MFTTSKPIKYIEKKITMSCIIYWLDCIIIIIIIFCEDTFDLFFWWEIISKSSFIWRELSCRKKNNVKAELFL